MAAGKAKADPLAPIRDRIQRLTVHLEKTKQKIGSNFVPARHATRAAAYKEWLQLEASRTAKVLEDLKLSLPAAK